MTKFEQNVRETWPEQADTVLQIIHGELNPETFASVRTWICQCYNRPSKHELIACALNEALETCGVEAVFEDDASWPTLEYLNMGDTYAVTLTYSGGYWRVESWGDAAERLGL